MVEPQAAPSVDPDETAVADLDAQPYADAWEHLQDELRRLDLRLRVRARQERRRPDSPPDAFRGLVVSDEEALGVLDDLDAAPASQLPDADLSAVASAKADAQDIEILQQLDRYIALRVAASGGDDGHLPLVRLSRICQWTSFEAQCVVVCLAPELDRRYEKLYGYLQDDVTRKRPTVALTLDLLCASAEEKIAARVLFDPQAPLFRYDVIRLGSGPEESPLPLLSRPLTIDDRIVDHFLGRQRIDARLGDAVRLVMPDEAAPSVVDEAIEQQVERLIEASDDAQDGRRHNTIFYLYGAAGSGRRALAEAVCRRMGIPLVVADLERLLAHASPSDAARRLAREAMLLPAALCVENVDALIDDAAKSALHLRPLLRACRLCSRLTFLVGRRSWLPPDVTSDEPFFSVEVKLPALGASPGVWESLARASGAAVAGDVDWGSLASRFRLGPTQIRDVLVVAGDLARWRTPSDPQITMDDLGAACRTIGAARLTTLSRKVEGHIRWNELILPANAVAQLKELCDHATYRHVVLGQWGFEAKLPLGRGLSALFCGPPGTGKTMAAQVIAGQLGLDLYRIDLSQVVSKYIGETEKNLRHVFDEAEATHAILFFDEADALFGKRSEVKDAHDRYANIEVGYLLQKMEEFEGIAILASNVRQNLDEAFVRRLRFIVEFPFPDEDDRRRIWEVTFPRHAPLAPDVDFKALAREVRLAGAHIRNIGLAAAFYAASGGGVIGMAQLAQAARREFEKLGRSWDDSASARMESLARNAGSRK